MLVTVGIVFLGIIAVISMIMMIGNVFAKSRYGRVWALIGGVSVFFAALLMALRILFPQSDVHIAASKDSKKSTTANSVAVTKHTSNETQPQASNTADGTDVQATGDDATDLSFLTTVLQYLKDGKSIPPEFLALLPDGGISYMEAQLKADAPAPKISNSLQTQLVSLARSEGRSTYNNSSYVPTHQPTPKPPVTNSGDGGVSNPLPPSNNNGGGSGDGGNTNPQPAPTPTPTPTPPVAGSLVSGGLLKSVLGHSKAEVKSYFIYNQFLGESNGKLEFLRGSAIVDVTMNGDTASVVTMRIGRFTPSGNDQTYYKDYMTGLAGMSDSTPSSTGGGNYNWAGVYTGASNVVLNIDMGSNSGSLTATL